MKGFVKIYKNEEFYGEYKNLIVNTGKAQVVNLINGLSTAAFKYMAIGTSNVASSSTQTALGNQIMIGTTSNTVGTTSVSGDTAVFQITFSFTTSYAITEVGIFNALSGGTMLNRSVIGTVNLTNGETLSILWQIIE